MIRFIKFKNIYCFQEPTMTTIKYTNLKLKDLKEMDIEAQSSEEEGLESEEDN